MKNKLIAADVIENKIVWIRGHKVMLDTHLAELYQVKTKALIQAVKRNKYRFPDDFMFQLTVREVEILRSQFVTSSWGGRRFLPYAFTEQGVAMLSSVLNSRRAIYVNIQIMRAFIKFKEMMAPYKDLQKKIESLERRHGKKFREVFQVIRLLLDDPQKPVHVKGFGPSENMLTVRP